MVAHFEFHKHHGAEMQGDGTVIFRLWAPSVDSVVLETDSSEPVEMARSDEGWYSAQVRCAPGTRYAFILPNGQRVPDPASRLQDRDVHDRSVVVDPRFYSWRHTSWTGRPWHEAVIYELHSGACGGFTGILALLPYLHELGVTAIELMPIGDFPGHRNWGYDGVLPYAPDAAYGTPDELKTLVDTAHGIGLMVILDVVYNHFGPDGAYAHLYANAFFDEQKHTPWGAAIDFSRSEVRSYFVDNAIYWLQEYRFDGLRFDAAHAINPQNFLDDMAHEIRASVSEERTIWLTLEHEGNRARYLRPGLYDAQWSDDFHHAVHVILTGEREGYYADFHPAASMLARCLGDGFAYQGEFSVVSGKPRGELSAGLPTTAFVICLQNHDQIGNRAFGDRLTTLADPKALRAAIALQILTPQIPLIFMGEEWGSRVPFLYFVDHNAELAEAVRTGRREEFRHFSAFKDPAQRQKIPDPNDFGTFENSKPDSAEAARNECGDALAFYRSLLAVRKREIVPRIPGCRAVEAIVLGEHAVQAMWRALNGDTFTILANLGTEAVQIQPVLGHPSVQTTLGAAELVASGTLPGATTLMYLSQAPQ